MPPSKSIDKAMSLFEANQLQDALKEVRTFLRLRPNHFEALQLTGAICSDLGRHEEALLSLRRATKLHPTATVAHYNLGKALLVSGDFSAALEAFNLGLRLEPEAAVLLCASGNALAELRRYEEATDRFNQAIASDAAYADSYYGLGRVFMVCERHKPAQEAFKRAVSLNPNDRQALLNRFNCGREFADWSDFEECFAVARAAASDSDNESVYHDLLLFDEPELHRRSAAHSVGKARIGKPLGRQQRLGFGEKIRIAYISADFCLHPTSRLLVGLIEQHDRDKFDVVGISIGGDQNIGALGNRIRSAFDVFLDLAAETSDSIRRAICEHKIDIAVDLMGNTKFARPELFTPRVAPIQINYLGYPGTSANPDVDYIVIDPFIAETFNPAWYSEAPLVVPRCYQPQDDRRPAPAEAKSRQDYGLPQNSFVFCCFNEPKKVTPYVFDSWMRILQAVPGSVLWLYAPKMLAADNFRAEAAKRGVDASRLIFCDRAAHEQHLARYRAADLFLDTFPYTAHTTASDALWSGCPVLTRVGKSFASRVCGSILSACGLPELITNDVEEYEVAAKQLALEPEFLKGLRGRIRPSEMVFFNTENYTREFEAALLELAR